MTEMTGHERIARILKHQPVDRIGLFEHFWRDTRKAWTQAGHLAQDESYADHFGFDMDLTGALNLTLDPIFQPVVVDENEDTEVIRDGNGALLRRHKRHDTTPEHVAFSVMDRAGWEEVKGGLTPDPVRINVDAYAEARAAAKRAGRFFCLSGTNVFERMHPVCGHEAMLVGALEDPDWIRDMVHTYAELIIALQDELFARAGEPDGIWFYEDMGFKHRPFLSPALYRELIQPGHRRTIDAAHARGLPVIMHSCGFVEPLLPGMVEAGIDALQVIEVKAGMDLLRIHRDWGHTLALIGGIDVRALYTNDLGLVNAELEAKIPTVKQGFGYVLHSDHSIPDTVDYATYRAFIQRGLELGRYA